MNAAAEEKKIMRALEALGEIFTGFVMGEDGFEFSRNKREFLGRRADLLDRHGPAYLREIKSEQIECGKLAGKRFGGGDADLGASVSVDGSSGLARDHGADYVADGERVGAFGFGFALGGDGVGGFSGLRNYHHDRSDGGVGGTIAIFAGVLHVDGDAGKVFDHDFASQAGMATRSAGGNDQLLESEQRALDGMEGAGE